MCVEGGGNYALICSCFMTISVGRGGGRGVQRVIGWCLLVVILCVCGGGGG